MKKAEDYEDAPIGIDGRPTRSKYEADPVPQPQGVDIIKIGQRIIQKRCAYYSDPTILGPLKYEPEELIVAKYLCEIAEFKPLSSAFSDFPYYKISMDARLLNTRTGFITKGAITPNGRLMFCLKCNGAERAVGVHILVCHTFLGDPPSDKHTVDHMDIDQTNNYAYNLRWATGRQQRYNQRSLSRPRRGYPVNEIDARTCIPIFTWFKSRYVVECYGYNINTLDSSINTGKEYMGRFWLRARHSITRHKPDGSIENEEWREGLYEGVKIKVSSFGRIWNRSGPWYGQLNSFGRRMVGLKDVNRRLFVRPVSRIVAYAFYGPPAIDSLVVDHIDHNPLNNHYKNLQYITQQENTQRSFDAGRHENNREFRYLRPCVQLTLDGRFVKEYFNCREAGRIMGCGWHMILRVCNGGRNKTQGFIWMWSSAYFGYVIPGTSEYWEEDINTTT